MKNASTNSGEYLHPLQTSEGGRLSFGMRLMTGLPWKVKMSIASKPTLWRMYSGICRRVGWRSPRPGWYASPNGPYAGILLPATCPNDLWVTSGTYEASISTWLVRLLTDERWGTIGRPVWDVGTHKGVIALLCLKHGAEAVFGFEPLPQNLESARMAMSANPALASRFHLLPFAVGDSDCELEFQIGPSDSEGQLITSQVEPSKRSLQSPPRLSVRCVCLDDYSLAAIKPPGIIKIDIEGAEVMALTGASECLRKFKPLLLLEIHNVNCWSGSVSLLSHLGFSVWQIQSSNRLIKAIKPFEYGHLLAVPCDHPALEAARRCATERTN